MGCITSCYYHRFVTRLTRRVSLVEQELPTLPDQLSSPSGFQWGWCYSIFSFMCMLCRSLFVLLYFFFWPLCCLFFDIWILSTPFKAVTRVSFLVRQEVWGPPRSPAGPRQCPGKGSRECQISLQAWQAEVQGLSILGASDQAVSYFCHCHIVIDLSYTCCHNPSVIFLALHLRIIRPMSRHQRLFLCLLCTSIKAVGQISRKHKVIKFVSISWLIFFR